MLKKRIIFTKPIWVPLLIFFASFNFIAIQHVKRRQSRIELRHLSLAKPGNKTTETSYGCVSFRSELENILNKSTQIFILTPAKTGGTSLKAFTDKCVGGQDPYNDGHAINNIQSVAQRKMALIESFKVPKIITAHIWKEDGFINLLKQATDDTAFIYVYRSESDRQIATMRQLISGALCRGKTQFFGPPIRDDYSEIYEVDSTKNCIVDEALMVDLFSERRAEMNCGIYKTLTCNSYRAMREINPNLIFVHYRRSGELQNTLSALFCPDNRNSFRLYDANKTPNGESVFVKLKRSDLEGSSIVPLEEWLASKRQILEWSLHIKKDVSCTGRTKQIENRILSCPDNAYNPEFTHP